MDSQNIENDVDADILKKDIMNVLYEMDDKYREILILKFIEDKSYDEISDILKKPPGTIATHINRAKKQFRDLCGKKDVNFLL